jgi:MFS transporter, DHA1 family, inner membrane transport protein
MSDSNSQKALLALLFGNLIIGTGVLLPAGMLNTLTADLNVNAASAGLMMTIGGIVVGFGAPILAGLTSRIDRRMLLTIALVLYAVGHIASALATNLTTLLVLRAVTVAGAAIFTPQAAATIGLIVPPERRGAAIGFIFIGWSLASVIGIPLGSLMGEAIGSKATFALMAGLSIVGMAAVFVFIPSGLKVQPLQLSSWLAVLRNRKLILVLIVTLFCLSGQFVMFTYLAPVLRDAYGLTSQWIAAIFFVSGLAGVGGSTLASRYVGKFGADKSVLIALSALAIGLAVVAVGWGNAFAFLIGACFWSAGGFAANSVQQGRLVGIAPALASATVALNSSFVYFGQSVGSATGGRLIANGASAIMPLSGLAFILAGIAISYVASRTIEPK